MTIEALQLNYLPESMKLKLPPTDCRLRGDLRGWDEANLDYATKEKNRLEENQRTRRAKVKQILSNDINAPPDWNISDERTFYNPQYFEKQKTFDEDGKKTYKYFPKKSSDGAQYLYWEERELGEWKNAPHIYEDNCEAFF